MPRSKVAGRPCRKCGYQEGLGPAPEAPPVFEVARLEALLDLHVGALCEIRTIADRHLGLSEAESIAESTLAAIREELQKPLHGRQFAELCRIAGVTPHVFPPCP